MTAITMLTVMISSEALCACAVLVTLAMAQKTVQVRKLPSPNVVQCYMLVCMFQSPIPTFPFPDIDECVLGTYVCDANAYCENTIGSYDCVCVDGYRKNGSFCMSKQ